MKGEPKDAPEGAGESVGRRAEDIAREEQEEGRVEAGTKGASRRPVGTSTARDDTGVDPQDPITQDEEEDGEATPA